MDLWFCMSTFSFPFVFFRNLSKVFPFWSTVLALCCINSDPDYSLAAANSLLVSHYSLRMMMMMTMMIKTFFSYNRWWNTILDFFLIEHLHPLQEELHTFEIMMSQMMTIAIMKIPSKQLTYWNKCLKLKGGSIMYGKFSCHFSKQLPHSYICRLLSRNKIIELFCQSELTSHWKLLSISF